MRRSILLFGVVLVACCSGCRTILRTAETFSDDQDDRGEAIETESRYYIRSQVFKLEYIVNGTKKTYVQEMPSSYMDGLRTAGEHLLPNVFHRNGVPVDIVSGMPASSMNESTTIKHQILEVQVSGRTIGRISTVGVSVRVSAKDAEQEDGYIKYFEKHHPLSKKFKWEVDYWDQKSDFEGGMVLLPGSSRPAGEKIQWGEVNFSDDTYRSLVRAVARRLKAYENPQAATKKAAVMKPRAEYTVKRFEKVAGSGTAYVFDIDYPEGADISDFKKNQASIRDLVQTDYAEANGADKHDVHVMFSSFKWDDNKLAGRAEVFEIEAPPYQYDSYTRRGKLSARVVNGDFGKARKWAIKHIEAIACSKNILLVTGEDPPPGKYKLLNESVKEDNTLEMEFEVE